jgi:hypothetical protein
MMRMKSLVGILALAVIICGVWLLTPKTARAHCDTLDGPVVTAAKKALNTGNINYVLIWVRDKDEPEINRVFQHTLSVRQLGGQARDLADTYFFETLVRVHRAGEGAPFTGLKPAGNELDPAVPAADRALASGSVDPLVKMLTKAVGDGTRKHFQQVLARKDFNPDDVKAGRAYVEAYVEYVHYVERLHEAATHIARGHYQEGTEEGH